MEETEIRKAALKNAMEHGGKASDGAVISKVVGKDRSLLKDMASLKKTVTEIVAEINSKKPEEQMKEAEELGVELDRKKEEQKPALKDLPNVKGKVVLRLPPEPSGFMHLGHAIAGTINYLYKEKYGGELWLRFEDTNPNLVRDEFVKDFEMGYKWLGIKWDRKKFITEDMDKMYGYAEKLIRDGKAYVCFCSVEEIKAKRAGGEACEHRDNDNETNIKYWNDAKNGNIEPGKAVVRFKGDLNGIDLSLRDPSIFRIVKTDYKPYSLWPIYDFASVIEDHLCGITHILRSNEFKVALQNKLRDSMGLSKPSVIQFSRYNFKGTPFSKRRIRELIKTGKIKSWDDLRLPTISAIIRRGIQPEAIKQFALSVGISESKHEYTWDLLLTLNRRIIDDKARRLFFVSEPVRLEVSGVGDVIAKLQNHPSGNLGSRTINTHGVFWIDGKDGRGLKKGDTLRLKDLYTVIVEDVDKGVIKASMVSEKMTGGEKIIQWVTDENEKVKVAVVGQLLNDDESFNENSLKTVEGLAEKSVELLKERDIIQFERFGFCVLDKKETNTFVYISR